MNRHFPRLASLALLLTACSGGGGGYGGFWANPDGGHAGDLSANAGDMPGQPGRDMAGFGSRDLVVGPNCGDGIKDGEETDVDCGGPNCGPCANGRGCRFNSDCTGQSCVGGFCMAAANCNDGIQNGSETDVDCGGGNCPPCANGRRCLGNGDCQSGNCPAGTCQAAASCNDFIKNGDETDVDCGGSCPPCSNGRSCLQGGDCTSFDCSNGVCCGAGMANCDGNKGNGCETNLNTSAQNCGACGNACGGGQVCSNGACVGGGGQKVMVGSYSLPTGPAWANMPPTYSCVEACTMLYGAGSYDCSTTANALDDQATVICYGVNGCQIKADTYKLGATYVKGSCSAYVADGVCPAATNYCWR